MHRMQCPPRSIYKISPRTATNSELFGEILMRREDARFYSLPEAEAILLKHGMPSEAQIRKELSSSRHPVAGERLDRLTRVAAPTVT